MRPMLITALVAAVAVAAGCDEEASTTTGAPVTADQQGALLTFERAGGVAFTAQRLEVQPDGAATVDVEGPGNIHEEFRLGPAELEALKGLLDTAEFEVSPSSGECADCYEYTLSHGDQVASFDSTSVSPGDRALIEFIDDVIERNVPSGPARGGA